MAVKKTKRRGRSSLLWGFVDRLTAMIYSFFINGRIGDMLSSRDTYCKRSLIARTYKRKKIELENAYAMQSRVRAEQGMASRALIFLKDIAASLRIQVYGVFLVFYGLSACAANIIPGLINGASAIDEMTLIVSCIIMVCSLPLLFSPKPAIEAISDSILMGRLISNIFCIPKERLKVKKICGGTVYVFASAVLGLILGGLSLYSHPLFIPVLMACVLILFVIFSSPEIGIMATLAIIPFMKYLPAYESILLTMVIVTSISYFFKLIQRKRTFTLSPELTMVMLFCGFVLVGGFSSSYGGFETFIDSLSAVVLIAGGLLMTYNLINSEKLLYACLKTLTASFLVLCLVGIWEGVYNGISKRIIDRISPGMSSLTEENLLYILDDGIVFGMFAIFVFPLLFAYASKRRSVRGFVAICSLGVIIISAAWMCSHYEIIVALIIEFIIFWFMFSHKTMSAVIFASVPIAIAVMLYPYAVKYLGWHDISVILMEYFPAGIGNSELHNEVMSDVLVMIADGNLFGIGAGESAFKLAFSPYAADASAGAEHPMSFVLQLLCWSGIFGLLAFAVFLIFLVKRSLGFFISAERRELRSKALAIFCGLMAALLLGNVYSIWQDVRVMYLFWVFTGLLLGHIRLADSEEDQKLTEYMNSSTASDVKVVFYD